MEDVYDELARRERIVKGHVQLRLVRPLIASPRCRQPLNIAQSFGADEIPAHEKPCTEASDDDSNIISTCEAYS